MCICGRNFHLIEKLALLVLMIASFGVTSAYAIMVSPADSLHFDNSDETNFVLKGNSLITNHENPSLKLNGIGDYLILDSSLPQKLNDFSISVWVKPDFNLGAPATLSIVSESQAFDLSINNDKIDKNIVTFSVYDGIKWHHVDSKSEIKDSWTHLAATYSDETISIFVNGVKENSAKVDGGYSFTYTQGVGTQNSDDYINFESNILIGAFTPQVRADGVVKNNFSGLIDDIGLYSISLPSTNISEIYDKNRIAEFIAPVIQNVVIQETGTPNDFGFVSSKNSATDKKIESLAYQGYKVGKQSGGFLSDPNNLEFKNTEQVNSLVDLKPIGPTTPEHEKTVSVGKLIKKLVRVESGSTSTFLELPSTDSEIMYNWKLYGLESGSLVDYSINPQVSFSLVDSNNDGTFDGVEWNIINNVTDFYLISEIL